VSAEENKTNAREAYEAFGRGDVEAASARLTDDTKWTVGGDNAVSGVYTGKDEIVGYWGKLAEKSTTVETHEFIADGDKVVALTTATFDGRSVESADVLTYDGDGNLVAFDNYSDETVANEVFAK